MIANAIDRSLEDARTTSKIFKRSEFGPPIYRNSKDQMWIKSERLIPSLRGEGEDPVYVGEKTGAIYEEKDLKCKSLIHMNSKGQMRVRGERLVPSLCGKYKENVWYVGEQTGLIHYSPGLDELRKRIEEGEKKNEKNKEEAIKDGEKAYAKYLPNVHQYVTYEIATDKIIVRLERKKVGDAYEYRKFYKDRNLIESEVMRHGCPLLYFQMQPVEGDEGIRISKEEYCELNIWDGVHDGVYTRPYKVKKDKEAPLPTEIEEAKQ